MARQVIQLASLMSDEATQAEAIDKAHELLHQTASESNAMKTLVNLLAANLGLISAPESIKVNVELRLLWVAAKLQDIRSDRQKYSLLCTLDNIVEELDVHDRQILFPLIEPSLKKAEICLLRDGNHPGLFFATNRLEVWNHRQMLVQLGRSRTLFALLEGVARYGDSYDMEQLFELAWQEKYIPPHSDSKFYVSMMRLRKKIKGVINIECLEGGRYSIETEPRIWSWKRKQKGKLEAAGRLLAYLVRLFVPFSSYIVAGCAELSQSIQESSPFWCSVGKISPSSTF